MMEKLSIHFRNWHSKYKISETFSMFELMSNEIFVAWAKLLQELYSKYQMKLASLCYNNQQINKLVCEKIQGR